MTKPQEFSAIFEDKQIYNQKFIHFSFELKQPHRLEYQAGQFLSLKVNQAGLRRSYSIISDPDISHGVEILLDTAPNGVGCHYLQDLQFGDQVEFLAPLGQFTISSNPQEQALTLIATGSGIAPFRSIILDQLKNKTDQRPIILYWGLRRVEYLIWEDELAQLSEQYANFSFHPVISQPLPAWPLCRGHVTDCLSIHELISQSGYYLCGNQKMITSVSEVLQKRGVSADKIHHEQFH